MVGHAGDGESRPVPDGRPPWRQRRPRGDKVASTASLPGGDPAVWSPVVRPQTIFTLDLAALGFERPTLDVRRHGGGGREDVFSATGQGEGAPFLRVVAYRYGSEVKPAGTLFVEMARRAAEAGLAVTRTTAPVAVSTRFGLAEASDVTLLEGERRHECLAWRLVRDDLDLRLTGWLCPGAGRRAERRPCPASSTGWISPARSPTATCAGPSRRRAATPPARPRRARPRRRAARHDPAFRLDRGRPDAGEFEQGPRRGRPTDRGPHALVRLRSRRPRLRHGGVRHPRRGRQAQGTEITVRPRSYFDAGNVVKPGTAGYRNYVNAGNTMCRRPSTPTAAASAAKPCRAASTCPIAAARPSISRRPLRQALKRERGPDGPRSKLQS